MNYGDAYAYRIDVAINNSEAFDKAQRELDEFSAKLYANQRAAKAASQSLKETSQQFVSAGAVTNRMTGVLGNAGAAVFQLANLMEDAQFGARALGNNVGMLVSTLGGFSPVAMAVGGVLQVLTAVFKDQIDAMLAEWGVLDKNLIPKTKEAEAAMDSMATATERVTDALKQQSGQVREAGQIVAKEFDNLSVESQNLLRQALLGQGGGTRETKVFEKRLQDAKDFVESQAKKGLRIDQSVIRKAEDELIESRKRQWEGTTKELDRLLGEVAKGSNEARLELAQLAVMAGGPELNRFAANLRDAADGLDVAKKKVEELAAEEEKLTQSLIDQGKANEEYTREVVRQADERARAVEEEERRKAEAARQARLDERTKLAVQSFGPMIGQQIGAFLQNAAANGVDPQQAQAQAIDNTMQFLMRAGLDVKTAGSTAQALVEDQSKMIEQLVWGVDAMVGMMREQLSHTRFNRNVIDRSLNDIRRLQIMGRSMNGGNNLMGRW